MEVALGLVGAVLTGVVIIAMVLIVPRGTEPVRGGPDEPTDPQGAELSPRPRP